MKTEHWIMAAGGTFCLAVLALAAAPGGFWNHDLANPPVNGISETAPARGGAETGRRLKWRRPTSVAGLVPFAPTESQRFRGSVTKMAVRGNDVGWGQVHVWLDLGNNRAREISVAPNWYLQHLGCSITADSLVKGQGYQFDTSRPDAPLYARKITVDGSTCRLRNDQGFALWSDRLR